MLWYVKTANNPNCQSLAKFDPIYSSFCEEGLYTVWQLRWLPCIEAPYLAHLVGRGYAFICFFYFHIFKCITNVALSIQIVFAVSYIVICFFTKYDMFSTSIPDWCYSFVVLVRQTRNHNNINCYILAGNTINYYYYFINNKITLPLINFNIYVIL